jgi:signal transduction histidine kinase
MGGPGPHDASAVDALRADVERLSAELAARDGEVSRLSRELEETNRGVVALYAELDDRAEALRRASEYKSRFLSMISHELRTPLTSVISLSGLLQSRVDGELTDGQERQVGYIRTSAQGLLEMVNDLLDLARIEAGKQPLRIREVPASDMMAALRGMVRGLPKRKAVQLVIDDPPAGLLLVTDDGKVAQVLRNYLSNALKFTEHGEVRLTCEWDAAAGQVTFTVRDTGVGIAPADQAAIFDEFAQVDHPLQHGAVGSGLGLAISRGVAMLLGGQVGVHSAPGAGAAFWLSVPRVHPRAGGATDPGGADD